MRIQINDFFDVKLTDINQLFTIFSVYEKRKIQLSQDY